ncbi:cupin domain-containing protein [Granulosicoccus antarcticus]|uniref:Cupin type-2 domain-containing protein n=1 Tax=Granulosicoccus antarcticus IMCC3135 TaxID=1192854 RepID=A0A2Z2NRY0_9GAMM|nr:cupin domain-containing protein [Granulosicoccus antarcticus]ASJ74222.1 hypothetical protein IMCC3135_20725 [Granulosicoccus antarcticus IMCC3135]
MTPAQMEARIVRYGDLQPCRTAFIDAHTPGSDQKENFTIIGGGVSESADQHVHIKETPGFNIGAAGQPPKCRNSLHTHRTAEVFFVLKGRWRFFWGRSGTAGEVILQEGDIFNIPTGIFRGFENVGTDYGMIMAVLGGDDAGGGVVWAPQVIQEASAHGLILGDNGVLYDSKQGQLLPEGVQAMPVLNDEQLAQIKEPTVQEVVSHYVARYHDMMALSAKAPCNVIGDQALIKDRPGFEVDFISRNSLDTGLYSSERHEILMVMRGHWRLGWEGGSCVLNPGDTCAVPPGLLHALEPSMSGEASLYRVRNTDDQAGLTKDFS